MLSSPLPHTVAPFRQNGQGLVSPPPSVLGTCHLALLPYILAAFPFSSVVRLFYITFSFFDILPVCDHLDIAFVPLLALIVPLIYAWRVFFTSLVLYHILYALWLQTECMFCIFLVNLTGWPILRRLSRFGSFLHVSYQLALFASMFVSYSFLLSTFVPTLHGASLCRFRHTCWSTGWSRGHFVNEGMLYDDSSERSRRDNKLRMMC